MNKETFIEEITKLGIDYNEDILIKLDNYKLFLQEYNTHTNLTTIVNDDDIYLKHFYDSLTIVKGIDIKKAQTLLDVGTGAGFPGMVLKIFYPHLEVTLLDSNNKKIKFLEELAKKLQISVNLVNERVENFAKSNLNKFDIVATRAVSNLRILTELCVPLIKVDGYFIALKGNIDENLEGAKETIEIKKYAVSKKISFNLYADEGIRNIIVITKKYNSILEELRPYDKILKKPLKKACK